jgi:SAM-dependent methyltransferase
MSSYIGKHAEFYDVFYASKPYQAEAGFVADRLQEQGVSKGSRVLEMACGTGTHAIHLMQRGYRVTAGDYSPSMLEVARDKAVKAGVDIEFAEMDMRSLAIADVPFDAVVCLFDSIGYVQTDEALGEVFRGVHGNLRENGVLIFEFWHAPAMIHGFDPLRVRRFPIEGGTLLRISETELLREQCLAKVTYNIYDLRIDGTYQHVIETQTNRYFTVPEMEQLALQYGFLPLAFYSGFDLGQQVSNDTWHVVTVWRKQ